MYFSGLSLGQFPDTISDFHWLQLLDKRSNRESAGILPTDQPFPRPLRLNADYISRYIFNDDFDKHSETKEFD